MRSRERQVKVLPKTEQTCFIFVLFLLVVAANIEQLTSQTSKQRR